jgi:hypothetical protein
LFEGKALSGATEPFLLDADAQERLLVVIPLLVGAERLVNGRMRAAVREMLARGLIADSARPRFKVALEAAIRLRDSYLLEGVLLAFVYLVGIALIWQHVTALQIDTWYWQDTGHGRRLTMAGWWYSLVSLPVFQFLLYRWYLHLWIWARFLWQVAQMDLKLIPTHPDQCAGLGFLELFCRSLVPLLLAHGALFAGVAAGGIFFQARTLEYYVPALAVLAGIAIVLVAGPMLPFVPVLLRARRFGLRDYGRVAQSYVRGFDSKWVHNDRPVGESLLGSPDIQSLADIGNSYQRVRDIRPIPVSRQLLFKLVAVTFLPIAPLSLLYMSAREVGSLLLRVLF